MTYVARTGSTAKRVCIVGDSAGATLAVATALRAISFGVRVPDGVLSIYGCLLVKYAPSPSRLLSLMDPLLPLGVLPKCLAGMIKCGLFYMSYALWLCMRSCFLYCYTAELLSCSDANKLRNANKPSLGRNWQHTAGDIIELNEFAFAVHLGKQFL
jgi:hypothetical protein